MKQLEIRTDLSNCETVIMRAIWECDGDISNAQLMSVLTEQFGKEYARTTLVTFLHRMKEKGFIESYRKGRNSYVHALIAKEDYLSYKAARDCQFWYKGDAAAFISNILLSQSLNEK